MTSEPDTDLGVYLSELYKNLNEINIQLEQLTGTKTEELEELDDNALTLMENQFLEWMGSFYNILIYLFCTSIAFLTAIVQINLRFIPITMMGIFPFYLWITFIYSIPEVKMGGKVILTRKNLTFKKQVKLARSLFIFFIRQLYENSKSGIMFMLVYSIFLVMVMTDEYLINLY